MTGSKSRRFVWLAAFQLSALCLPACSSAPAGGPAQKASLAGDPPRVVRVARPEPVSVENGYPSSLYIEEDVVVTARTSGLIEQVLFDRGDTVRAGEALAVLETDLATREVEIAAQDLRLAEAEFDRVRSLHDQEVVSPHEFLEAEIARDQAISRLEWARAQLERCTVRAPFDGVVVERWAVAGQRVQEEDGEPLFRVVARHPLRARVDVPEEKVASLRAGAGAAVDCLDGDAPHPARVVFVSPAVDAASGTAPVIVQMSGRAGHLKLGSSVRVRFDGDGAAGRSHVRIPLAALPGASARGDTLATVMVVAGGRAAARRVRVVESRGGSVTVEGPLTPADRLILGAGGDLREGDPVTPGEGRR